MSYFAVTREAGLGWLDGKRRLRPARRRRLPHPVPLRRLRSLPHRRLLPPRPHRLPGRPAAHPERLAAAIDGVDGWARANATPAQEEITRIRRLISRINGDIAQLPDAERAQVDEAVTVIRKHRAVSLSMPAVPTVPAGKALA
jgi:hypothetical protein